MLPEGAEGALRSLGVRDGERIGVACSGGADSVALVHLLSRTALSLDIVVLHVDHAMRPDSAEDAVFVREVATRLGLRCEVFEVTVESASRLGPEAAAREARYAALDRAASNLGLKYVATAHTLDDQAETVLLRATRGGNLAGIEPVRGVQLQGAPYGRILNYIRPLLGIERSQLREWLVSEGIEWREDPTNEDMRFERNWMRGAVLPILIQRRPGVNKVLARLADNARADGALLDALAEDVVAGAETDDAGTFLPRIDLLPRALTDRAVRLVMRRRGHDPTWSDLEAIRDLRAGGSVRCGELRAWRLPDGLALIEEPIHMPDPIELPLQGTLDAAAWGMRVRVGESSAPAWTWRCVIPASASGLTIRSRSPGDRVHTPAGTRKVQDVLVDAKIPRPLRDFVPVVATSTRAVAVVGLTNTLVSTSMVEGLVVDAEPAEPTWSRSATWHKASV